MPLREMKNEPCEKCGCIVYVHVPATPEEMAGWDCHNCGKGFIPDKIQPRVRMPIPDGEWF